MKIRSLAILSMVTIGLSCTHAEESGEMMGTHHMMIEHLFGDKDKISKEDFVKHFEKKFDAIDEGKTGEITKDQAIKYFDEKWKKKMQEKFCSK